MCTGPPDCPLPGPHLAGLQYHRPGPGADDQRYVGSTNLVAIPSILVVTTTSLEALPKMLTDILYSLLVHHIDLLLLF